MESRINAQVASGAEQVARESERVVQPSLAQVTGRERAFSHQLARPHRDALQVHLFGKFSAEREGYNINGLRTRRLQQLLSYLLINRHQRCSRESLANLFWGESLLTQAKKNLRQLLWQLQTALDMQVDAHTPPILIVTANWLQINPQAKIWLDVDFFEQVWNQTKHLEGKDLDTWSMQLLRSATGLHQDVLLSDNYDDWCLKERERLLLICIRMLEKLIDYSKAHHDYATAILYCSRILSYDRTHEATYQQLMQLHYLQGDRTEALKYYRKCEVTLKEDLGALPSKKTRLLYQQISLEQLDGASASGSPAVPAEAGWKEEDPIALILRELQQIQMLHTNAQRHVQHHIEQIEQILHNNGKISIYSEQLPLLQEDFPP
ncbi:MAG TPA: BTAD domain-containing putative transcriptional regulator [Ktedonobacteraceae bacterium]|jgi:DNA-binding SARP family transcriptional activator